MESDKKHFAEISFDEGVTTVFLSGFNLLETPEGRAELTRLRAAAEKAAREKARGMTDEEWEQANQTLAYAATRAGERIGETFKIAAREIQALADIAVQIKDQIPRPRFSKKRGRKTTW